ncbi:MAG: GNAT family N-acetyltransferase, partial [Staphylococcus equorum]|nr:GNAT family N-acetyltransferase [Staphylococcus equorum]
TENFTSYVNLLVISESYSHQGIGNSLLQTFETEAKKHGMLLNALKVVKGNESAIKLYKKSGYKIVADDNDRYVLNKLL